MKKIWILLTIYMVFTQTSCEDPCDDFSRFNPFNTVYFEFVSIDNGKELTEEINRYDRDSITLIVDNIDVLNIEDFRENIYTQFSIKNSQYDLAMYNDSLYLLYLNYQDTDTIQIQASNVEDGCNGNTVSRINVFVHNGDTLFDETLGIGNLDFVEIKK